MGSGNHMKLAILLLTSIAYLHPQELSRTTEPIVIHKTEPQYTKEALDAKIEGDVMLSSMIGADGVPSDIKLVRGLGKGLDEKAVECLKQWRFKPATNYFNEPVSAKATAVMNFRLPRTNEQQARMNPTDVGLGSPRLSWAQATEGPTVKVVFSVDDTMELPAFKATCDRPCSTVTSEATGKYEPAPISFENEPKSVGLTLRSPRPLGAGVRILWVIGSLDERPITITDFRILEIGEVPAELRH